MKRDMDMIRAILMDIEENANINGKFTISDADFAVAGAERTAVQYHLRLLLDAGYIEGQDILGDGATTAAHGFLKPDSAVALSSAGIAILVTRMTWDGHDFLDTVRDSKIWEKTKDALKGVGGVGVDTIKDVAKEIGKAVINHQVKKHTGIDLGL